MTTNEVEYPRTQSLGSGSDTPLNKSDVMTMKTLEEYLAAIVRRFGVVLLSESDDGFSGYCISDGVGSEACCATFECVAELFAARFCSPAGAAGIPAEE